MTEHRDLAADEAVRTECAAQEAADDLVSEAALEAAREALGRYEAGLPARSVAEAALFMEFAEPPGVYETAAAAEYLANREPGAKAAEVEAGA